MIPFKNNIKKSTLSFKVIVVCLLLSGSLITPGFASANCYTTNEDGTILINDDECTESQLTEGSLVIDDTVTSIGEGAFDGNTALTSVTIPNSVLSIGTSAFRNTALRSVTIGNSVTSIGASAFSDNTSLTSVTIPDSVTSIGSAAFQYNFALRSVTIGNSVTSIGDDAFRNNTALTSVTFGSSVTSIGDDAFYDNISLTSVTIPNSVLSIGNGAFYNNNALTSVIIGNSVTSIGDDAFYNNISLTSVTFLRISALSDDAVGDFAFLGVAEGAIANVAYNATGFPADGLPWNGLIVRYASAPAGDSGSSSPNTVATITSTVVQTADASFKLTNRKYLSKFEIRKAITKGRSFKRKPIDIYKYSISKRSKKNCVMRGNYVMGLKKTGSCDLNVTRTTAKGAKYKYWVKINYIK